MNKIEHKNYLLVKANKKEYKIWKKILIYYYYYYYYFITIFFIGVILFGNKCSNE